MPVTTTRTIGAGKDHADLAAFATWLQSRDLVANDEVIIAHVYDNQTVSTQVKLIPATFSASNYCIVRPAPGAGVNDLDTTGALDYGTVGVELTITIQYGMWVSYGVSIEDFRIKVNQSPVSTANPGVWLARYDTTNKPHGSFDSRMRRCRILCVGGFAAVSSNANSSYSIMEDCLIINEYTSGYCHIFRESARVDRCTFIMRGAAAGRSAVQYASGTTGTFRDSVISGSSNTPIVRTGTLGTCTNNFSDTSITGTASGFSVAAGLFQGANDYRPATGGPLVTAASTASQNTRDLRGKYRGTIPDVGASQLNEATLPAVPDATITSVTTYGQKLIISGTLTSAADSGTVSVPAAATPNGAVSRTGTVSISGSTFSVTLLNMSPGNYDTPVVTLTNVAGNGSSSGGAPFTISVPAVPVVTIGSQSKSTTTVTISGTVQNYPVSGSVSLPAAAVNPNGAVTKTGSLTIQDDGNWTVTLTSVSPGNYDAPVITCSNYSGSGTANGQATTIYAAGTQPPGLPAVDLPPFVAPTFNAPTIAADGVITTFKIENTTAGALTNHPFTFGHPFKQGQLKPGDSLSATIQGVGSSVDLQFNVKSTWPDGSVRHGIISGVLATLAASTTITLDLIRRTTSPDLTAMSSAALVSGGFSATASIVISGTTYTADPASQLTAGIPAKDIWLSGPICTEWIVDVPFATGGGTQHATMTAQFNIRHYPGPNVTKVDIAVENTSAYATLTDVTYDVTLNVNGSTYAKTGLTHFPYARWKKQLWRGTASALHVQHNVPYVLDTKMVPNYDRNLVIDETKKASWETDYAAKSWEPMAFGGYQPAMGTTGGRADIGIAPSWHVAWLLTQDKRVRKYALAAADVGGSWSHHRRDRSTGPGAGLPLDALHWPYCGNFGTNSDCTNPATGQVEKLPSFTSSTTGDFDVSHHPAFAYIPYMLTGDYFYMEEHLFLATALQQDQNPAYREYHKSTFTTEQLRGQGWCMRTFAEAAAILPDNHPQKPAFQYWVKNNIDYYNTTYTYNTNANKLGCVINGATIAYTVGSEPNTGLAPWMDDFFTQAYGHAWELGYSDALPLLQWKAKFQVGRMLAPGYCWIHASIYALKVRDTAGSPLFETLGECWTKSVSTAMAATSCNSQAMRDVLNAERALPSPEYVANQMVGYAGSDMSFPANFQPALAYAVDSGYTDGDLAWDLFVNRALYEDYSKNPEFSVMSRTATGIPVSATPPSAPQNVSASVNGNVVTVTFDLPADSGGAPITSYTVTAVNGGQTATGSGSPISITMPAGATSTYTVAATNSAGTGAASAPSNSVTTGTPATAPGAPTNVVATTSNGNVSVAFTAPASDGGSPITSYQANASTGPILTGTVSPIVFTSLTPGVPVSFTVHAVNAVGPGPSSAQSNTVTPIAPAVIVDSVTVIPETVTVAGGGQQQFTAIVAGQNAPSQEVTWTSSAGVIDSTGMFTAPLATIIPQEVTITAVSVADPTKFDTTLVTVPATAGSGGGETPTGPAPLRHYTGNITNKFGVAIEGASVLVINSDTGEKAVLWKDKNKVKQAFNPLITDSEGLFEFYVEAVQCSYTVRGDGIETYTREDIFDIISNADLTPITQAIQNLESTRASVTQLEQAVAPLAPKTDVQAVSGTVTEVQNQVTAIDGRTTANEGAITTLQGRATANENAITTLQGRATANENAITTLQGADTALDGRLDTAEAAIAAHDADIIGIDGRVAALENAPSGPVAIVDVHANVTAGTGTLGDPWTGWDTGTTWNANTQYEFRDGYYAYVNSPNFAKNFLRLNPRTNTVFVHTGTGNAVTIDGGADNTTYVTGLDVKIKVRSNAGAAGGVLARGISQSKIDVDIVNAPGVAYSDYSSILNDVTIRVTAAQRNATIFPTHGLVTGARAGTMGCVGNEYKLMIENCTVQGLVLSDFLNNKVSGTVQYNPTGMTIAASSKYNNFDTLIMGNNGVEDARIYGVGNMFNNCRSSGIINNQGANNIFRGGMYDTILANGTNSSYGPLMYGINGGRFADGSSSMTKNGVYNVFTSTFDVDVNRPTKDLEVTGKTKLSTDLLVVGDGQFVKNGVGQVYLGTTAPQGAARFTVANPNNTANDINYVSILGSAGNVATAYHLNCTSNGADVARILGNGNMVNTAGSYGVLSDSTLKTAITPATPKLDQMMQVEVVNYELLSNPGEKLLGVLAQQLETIFPGMIEEIPELDEERNPTGRMIKVVKMSVFVPMLIQCVQELNVKIDSK